MKFKGEKKIPVPARKKTRKSGSSFSLIRTVSFVYSDETGPSVRDFHPFGPAADAGFADFGPF